MLINFRKKESKLISIFIYEKNEEENKKNTFLFPFIFGLVHEN